MANTPTRNSRTSNSSSGEATSGRSASESASDNVILNRSGEFSAPTATSREARIAEAAYYRAERRGFSPGNELEDWYEAEREVDAEEPRTTALSS